MLGGAIVKRALLLALLLPAFVRAQTISIDTSQAGGGRPSDAARPREQQRPHSHGAADYTRSHAGRSAAIAVMGPDIDRNLECRSRRELPACAGRDVQLGAMRAGELGDFEPIASLWSRRHG